MRNGYPTRQAAAQRSSYGTAQPGDRQRAQLFAFLQDSSSPIGVSGCGRLSPAVCGECARKLLWERRFRWSARCRPWSVNPSRKLRRFESFTCHHVLKGPLTCGNAGRGPLLVRGGGIESGSFLAIFTALGRRPMTCANASTEPGGVEVRAEYVRKFGFTPPRAGLIRALICSEAKEGVTAPATRSERESHPWLSLWSTCSSGTPEPISWSSTRFLVLTSGHGGDRGWRPRGARWRSDPISCRPGWPVAPAGLGRRRQV